MMTWQPICMSTRMDRLEQAGFVQYEISNWAADQRADGSSCACRHNMQYWLNGPIWVLGLARTVSLRGCAR